MSKLTLRSKITVRWTTAPSDMGYGGNPTKWREMPGETMSIRNAAKFSHELGQRIGQGTYRRIEYSHRGEIIDIAEIHEAVQDAEYREMQRR